MKFTSVAIVAAFLCVAAFAAPSPSLIQDNELFSFAEELGRQIDDESIELFDDHLPQFPLPPFLAKIKCQTRAIDRGVAGTKYQEIFDEHRFWMHEMIDNIQGVCVKKTNKLEAAVCIGESLKKGLPSLVPFVKQLLAMKEELKSQPELAAKVAAELAKCNVATISADELFSFAELINQQTDDESIELFDDHLPQFPLPPFLAKIKCQTRAIDRGVAGTKYQEIFDEHRFWMHEMIDNIQGVCVKKSNKLETAVCIGKSLKKGLPSLVPFVKQLLAMKEELKSQPELAAKVAAELAKCNVATISADELFSFAELINQKTDDESIELFDDHLPQFPLPPFLAKIKCQTRAIDRGVAGTKYQEIFDEHRFWMHEMIDNIQGVCVKKSNKLETAVCIGKSLKKGLPSLVPFVKQLLAMKEELKSQPELAAKVAAEMAKCNV